jgi:hypothetical protein
VVNLAIIREIEYLRMLIKVRDLMTSLPKKNKNLYRRRR